MGSLIGLKEAETSQVAGLFKLFSSSRNGLTSKDASARLEKYGRNEIIEKKVNPVLKFLSNFWGPIQWMIEAAAIISLVIGRMDDFAIIMMLLLVNVLVKYLQERKANNAIELLKRKLSPSAKVRRNGKWITIAATNLVPGDIVRIRLGDIVPADIKLIDGEYLEVDQAALTGESLPVNKSVGNVCYSGSIVRNGEMDALVLATGMDTYFGKTAKLAQRINEPSHFQQAATKIGNYLIIVTIILVMVSSMVEISRGAGILKVLEFALVLTIAGVPVALPTVLSVTMVVGAIVLTKKNAIVSKLVTIEEMAGMDVLCVDKTGTLTESSIKVSDISAFGDYSDSDVILYASLASREEDKDPIDLAIMDKLKSNRSLKASLAAYNISKFKPFNPVIKRTAATVSTRKLQFQVSKGATQVISKLCTDGKAMETWVAKHTEQYAKRGYRTLAVARTYNNKWRFVGLISLSDPPRSDSAETIRTTQSMGLKVKMITGDHEAIALETAKEVGLGTQIESESEIEAASGSKSAAMIERADGFSEVFPEHKYNIVKTLEKDGHIVGMTGDGVNDVPALQKADVGVAVAGATDAAKSAADIVLTDPGISVIIDAVKESRKIFQRMKNYTIYRLGETIRLVFFIILSIIIFKFYPITPLMVVLLALLNDLPIMTISYDNVYYSEKPERWDMGRLLTISTILGLFGVAISFTTLSIGINIFHLNHLMLESFIYLWLSIAGHLFLLVARTKKNFWTVPPARILISAIIVTQTVATLLVGFGILLPKIGWGLVLFIWCYALAWFVVTDFVKLLVYKVMDRYDSRKSRPTVPKGIVGLPTSKA